MKCEKFCEKVDKAILITMIIMMLICVGLIVGQYMIAKRIEEGQWLDPQNESYAYQACVICYFVFYLLGLLLTITKIAVRKQFCGVQTAIFMIFSLVLVIFGGALASHLTQKSWDLVQSDNNLANQCDEGKEGLVASMNKGYIDAAKVFCSSKCPCSMSKEL
jgi:hypothetical protein